MSITVFIAVLVVALGAYVAMCVLYSVGLNRMLKSCGYKKPWFAYLPFFQVFALGCLAEICNDGRPPKKYSRILLSVSVTSIVIMLTYYVVTAILAKDSIFEFINLIMQNTEMTDSELLEAYSSLLTRVNEAISPAFMLSLLNSLMSIVYLIYTIIVLVRVFRIFAPEKMFLFLLLSVFIIPAKAIIFFIIRKNPPRNLRWQQNDLS